MAGRAAVGAAVVLVATGLPVPIAPPGAPHLEVVSVALAGEGADAAADLAAVEAVGAETTSARGNLAAPAGPGWHARVTLPTEGEMVILEWDAPTAGALRLRSSDGAGWSPWVDVDGNLGEGPDHEGDGKRLSAGPVWVGRGTRQVELIVESGALANFRVDVLHSVEPSGPGSPWGTSAAGASPAAPAIVTRAQWGAGPWRDDNPGCEPAPVVDEPLRFAIVHHTASANDYAASDSDDLMRGIYYAHTVVNLWCDIAYNAVVDRYGQVFEGRSGGLTNAVRGGHARGFNSHSFGVALLGQHQPGASPPAAPVAWAEREALHALLSWRLGLAGIDPRGRLTVTSACVTDAGYTCKYPSGTPVTLDTITSHRTVSYTSCPGDDAMSVLPGLRLDVGTDVITSTPYPLTGWQPAGDGPALLTLDAFGGVHPAGSAWVPGPTAHWGSWAIARSGVLMRSGGYQLDGWGGLHPFGGAPATSTTFYAPGWDIARDVAKGPAEDSGYVLDGWGGLHQFGGAPGTALTFYQPGWDIARAMATNASGLSGYVLDGWGGVHQFGSAPPAGDTAYWPGWDIARDVALRPDGHSGYVLDGWGGLHPFGGAPGMTTPYYTPGADTAKSLTLTVDGTGGWILDADGHLWAFGSAPAVSPLTSWTGFGAARQVMRLG